MLLKNLFFLKNSTQKYRSDKNIREYSMIFLAVSIFAPLLLSKSNKYGKEERSPTTYKSQPMII